MYRAMVQQWYDQYKTGIFRFALSILKDAQLAEDVLQEVFLRLLTGKYTVEPGREKAWLYRVARNCCYDILRKRKREQPEQEGAVRDESGYGYMELISTLGQAEQEIVTLKIVGGLTHREIAKTMGMTEHAVKKRYERSIQKLREEETGWKRN